MVTGKTELILPDEWPEFPTEPGTYHIGITSRDDLGIKRSLLLSGPFKFLAHPLRQGAGSTTFNGKSLVTLTLPVDPMEAVLQYENTAIFNRLDSGSPTMLSHTKDPPSKALEPTACLLKCSIASRAQ